MEVIDELNHLVSQEQIDKERLGVIAENQERLTDEIQELQEKLQREEENQKSLLQTCWILPGSILENLPCGETGWAEKSCTSCWSIALPSCTWSV